MSAYLNQIAELEQLKSTHAETWKGISAEYAARMQLQNRFKTGLDIAQYTADIMRKEGQAGSCFRTSAMHQP